MDATRVYASFARLFPVLQPVVTGYASSLIKAHKTKLRLNFLRECLKEQVIPRSFLPRRLLEMRDRPFDDLQRIVLMKFIQRTKVDVQNCFRTSNQKRMDFNHVIPTEWKTSLLDHCYKKLRRARRRLEVHLRNKLLVLVDNSDWNKHTNPQFAVNLSDKILDKNTVAALGYGLNFAVCKGSFDYAEIAKSFCNLEKFGQVPCEDVNICKGVVYGFMSQPHFPNVPARFMKSFESLKREENIYITKADKSNTIVILNKNDYTQKVFDLLSDTSTYECLGKNPLEKVNSDFNKKLKGILRGREELLKQFITQGASLPYMYGLIKTHIENNPVRPIISSIGSASYKLSKWLVRILTPLVGNISHTTVKNNVDLVEKLNDVNVNFDFKLVSFDVTSLFTRVPVHDLLSFLSEELDNFDLPFPSDMIIELIKLCIIDSKFVFQEKFYIQKFGMAMGNPLSPVLSNLYMEYYEKRLLPSILPNGVTWNRYVDDIVCVWPVSEDVEVFLYKLNGLVLSIKFTFEEEKDGILPFLDVSIHRIGKKFKFSVYRKPTNVCSYIHYYSSHSDQVKASTFSSMFLRALRICSPEFLEPKIDKIYNIAFDLKYPHSVIDKAFKMARKTFFSLQEKTPFKTDNLLVLPYSEKFKVVPKLLKTFNVNVVFSNTNTVRNMLIKNSPKNTEGCIYEVPCRDCSMKYIGQTGKALNVRLKQHQYSVRTFQSSNAIFLHKMNFDHHIDWQNCKSIIACKDYTKRNILESALIKFYHGDIMNISVGLFKLDGFIIEEIIKQLSVNIS